MSDGAFPNDSPFKPAPGIHGVTLSLPPPFVTSVAENPYVPL
jgi:hypothetical protein